MQIAQSLRSLGGSAYRKRRDRRHPDVPLQLLFDKGITEHLAFKGGTMLRKMVFGPRGRLSTDLDFTHRTDIHIDDLMLLMLDVLARPYHGISFRFDKDKDWYLT